MTARRHDTVSPSPIPPTPEVPAMKTETTAAPAAPVAPAPKPLHLIAQAMVDALTAGDFHLARLFMVNLPIVRPGERWIADEAQASEGAAK